MTDVKAELLPCPFCGGEAAVEPYRIWDSYVRCRCGVDGPTRVTDSEAITAWNTRAESQPTLPEGVEAVASRVTTSDHHGSFIVTDPGTYRNGREGWTQNGWRIEALFTRPATPLPTGRGLDEDLKIIGTMVAHYCDNDQFDAWERILASLGGVDKGAPEPNHLYLSNEAIALIDELCTERGLDLSDTLGCRAQEGGGGASDAERALGARLFEIQTAIKRQAAPDPTPSASQEGES